MISKSKLGPGLQARGSAPRTAASRKREYLSGHELRLVCYLASRVHFSWLRLSSAGRDDFYLDLAINGGNVVAYGDYLGAYLSVLKKNPQGIAQYRGGLGLSGGEAW